MFSFVLLVFFAAGIIATSTGAQTIARRDLSRFVGAVAFPDPARLDAPDLSKFIAWYIDSVDSSGRRYIDQNPPARSADTYWVASPRVAFHEPNANEGWALLPTKAGWFYYVILGDASGYMDQWNLLSVWRQTGPDSLTLVCIDYDNYNSSMGYSKVMQVGSFPDKSIFLYVHSIGSDEDSWKTDAFLRSTDSCHFERISAIFTASPSLREQTVIADHIDNSHYKVTVVTDYFTYDSLKLNQSDTDFEQLLDSARAEVIDLWQLAIQKFGIDTTAISRNH